MSALVGGEWSASLPGRFTPREKEPGTWWIRGWVGPIASLCNVERRKILHLPGLKLIGIIKVHRNNITCNTKKYCDCRKMISRFL
jgi:hypothetical protein